MFRIVGNLPNTTRIMKDKTVLTRKLAVVPKIKTSDIDKLKNKTLNKVKSIKLAKLENYELSDYEKLRQYFCFTCSRIKI